MHRAERALREEQISREMAWVHYQPQPFLRTRFAFRATLQLAQMTRLHVVGNDPSARVQRRQSHQSIACPDVQRRRLARRAMACPAEVEKHLALRADLLGDPAHAVARETP